MGTWTCWRDPKHGPIHTTGFGWPHCSVCQATPAYHDRPAYLPDDLVLDVYVPAAGEATAIMAERSAIVGLPVGEDEWVEVYYEGWVNGPAQYADRDARGLWEAGVEHAGGRMVTAYPTSARAHIPSGQLKLVGRYHPKTRQVTVDDEEALDAWLNQ